MQPLTRLRCYIYCLSASVNLYYLTIAEYQRNKMKRGLIRCKIICKNLSNFFVKIWQDFVPSNIIKALFLFIGIIFFFIVLISINRVGVSDIHIYADVYSKDSVSQMYFFIDCGEQNNFNVLKSNSSLIFK